MNIVYLHGYNSGPNQEKALFFKDKFAKLGVPFFAPDMGETFVSHSFTEKLDIAEKALTKEPTIIIGSSLGGYIAALVASRNPQVTGVVLMAPAFGWFKRYPMERNIYPMYPDVKCPTLIFVAGNDELIPIEEILDFNHELIVIPDADHRFTGLLSILWFNHILGFLKCIIS